MIQFSIKAINVLLIKLIVELSYL